MTVKMLTILMKFRIKAIAKMKAKTMIAMDITVFKSIKMNMVTLKEKVKIMKGIVRKIVKMKIEKRVKKRVKRIVEFIVKLTMKMITTISKDSIYTEKKVIYFILAVVQEGVSQNNTKKLLLF